MSYIKPQITLPSPLKVATCHGVAEAYLFGGFCSTMWKTRQKNPPIDWEVGEGGRYAFGLAWLIFTTAIVF